MEKSALKQLVEETVSDAIREIQLTAFPKLNSQQRALGNSGIYNRAKREAHRIANGLPDNISKESEVQELCRFLDSFDFESLNDPRFRGSVKAIVIGARKKFATALKTLKAAETKPKQQTKKNGDHGPASIRESVPAEETFPVTTELYVGYVTYKIIDCFPYLQNFFQSLSSKAISCDATLREDDMKNAMEVIKHELIAMIEEIQKLILERNPYTEGAETIIMPWPEIIEIMRKRAMILKDVLRVEITEEQIDQALQEFEPKIAANLTPKIPTHVNKKQKHDIEDTEFQAYVIEHSVESSLTEAVKIARRPTLQPAEKEQFLTLVVDQINEKIPEPDAEKVIEYFKTYSGEEFLVDIACLFNDSFHGGIEVRDQKNLLEQIETHLSAIIQKCNAIKRVSQPATADEQHEDTKTAPGKDPAAIDEMTSKMAEFAEWAKQFQKPGTQLLFKLFAAAGVTLETYGSTLSAQQKLIVFTLFDSLREIVEEREELNKRRAVRIEKLVEAILEALKPVAPKPETKARIAIEKLEQRIAELEEAMEELVMETGEIGSLQQELEQLEAQNSGTSAALKAAQQETANAKNELDESKSALIQLNPGSDEFTTALGTLNEKNMKYLGCKSALDGITSRSEIEEAKWVELSRRLQSLEVKMGELRELEDMYRTIISEIDKI